METALLIKRGFTFDHDLIEPNGWLISIDVGSFTFIDIYTLYGAHRVAERNVFIRKTILAYECSSSLPLILLGDFNGVDNFYDRSTNTNPVISTRPFRLINRTLTERMAFLELDDIWLKPHATYRGRSITRIDHQPLTGINLT